MAMGGISDEAIQERAYHIWVREGATRARLRALGASAGFEAEERAGAGQQRRFAKQSESGGTALDPPRAPRRRRGRSQAGPQRTARTKKKS
jgi:hypothetical protein